MKPLAEAAEIEAEQQRSRGLFDRVPHYGEIEDAGQQLGRPLSRLAQSRLANEVASGVADDEKYLDNHRDRMKYPDNELAKAKRLRFIGICSARRETTGGTEYTEFIVTA